MPPGSAATDAISLVQRRLAAGISRRAGAAPSAPRPDGTWADIDYTDQARANWRTRVHAERMRNLAAHGATAPALAALDHWLARDYRNPNWWHDEIGTPLLVGETLILLGPSGQDRVAAAAEILARGDIRTKPAWFRSGQNQLWFATVMLCHAVLRRSGEDVAEAMRWAAEPMAVTSAEGIQRDGSFHQHGPQLSNGGYGASFLDSAALLLAAVEGTPWAVPDARREAVIGLLLDGTRWMSWEGQPDWGAMGRELVRQPDPIRRERIPFVASELATLATPRGAELTALATRTTRADATRPHGGRYFPRSDYLAHRRPGWTAMIKLGSRRVLASETCNDENLMAEGLAHGLCLIRQRGDEYAGLPPLWDWSLLPGSTQIAGRPRQIPWDHGSGAPHQSSRGERTGGLADQAGSLAVHHLVVNGLEAIKTWFAADAGLACVTAVAAAPSGAAVRTTLIAQRRRGPVRILDGGVWRDGVSGPIAACRALWHDQVLWMLPDAPAMTLRLEERGARWDAITTAYGDEQADALPLIEWWTETPPGTDLRWLALPGQPEPSGAIAPPPAHLAAGPGWSACWWPAQQLGQLIFTAAGRADGPWGSVASDQPLALQLDRTSRRLLAAETGRGGAPAHLVVDGRPIVLVWPTGDAAGSAIGIDLPPSDAAPDPITS